MGSVLPLHFCKIEWNQKVGVWWLPYYADTAHWHMKQGSSVEEFKISTTTPKQKAFSHFANVLLSLSISPRSLSAWIHHYLLLSQRRSNYLLSSLQHPGLCSFYGKSCVLKSTVPFISVNVTELIEVYTMIFMCLFLWVMMRTAPGQYIKETPAELRPRLLVL